MLRNYSKLDLVRMVIVLPVWVLFGIYAAQLVLGLAVALFKIAGISLASFNEIMVNTVLTALLYVLSVFIVIGLPWLIIQKPTTKEEVGLTRLPSWTDILLAPAGFIVYAILSSALIMLATQVFPWFNADQVQQTGFDQVSRSYELVLAFLSLVVIAPVFEEILFRGFLYGKLKKYMPVWIAIVATSVLFGFVHGAWNLAFDTFALSVILCILRELTGSIWASVLLHMVKNAVAFYILFINK
ncbi:MAG: type II CAAX endopeptidase family protein [Candidatus Saccharimonadales bacterium]